MRRYEQRNLDEQDARAKSIHRDPRGLERTFRPGGLWDKWEPPPGGWGFAAAGFLLPDDLPQVRDRDLPPSLPFPRLLSPSLTFLLPDDLPQTAKRYGSFYNIHAHQFRATAPKTNLYM